MMINWFKVAIYAIIFLFGISLGFGICSKVVVSPLKADIKVANSKIGELSTQLNGVIEVNEANTQVFNSTMALKDKAIKSLETRLKAKNAACEEALAILNLHGGIGNGTQTSDDPILNMLNSLYNRM